MELTVDQIARVLDGKVEGDGGTLITGFARIQEASAGQLSFLANDKYEHFLYSTKASAVIISSSFQQNKEVNTCLIRVADPYAGFTALLDEYQRRLVISKIGEEQPIFTGDNSSQGPAGYRGAFSYVGSDCILGNNVKIYPHVFVGDNCVIDDDVILFSGVKIYAGTKIRRGSIVHSGSVIGSDGFGFAPQQDGSYKAIPQLGHVELKENVSIGANTVIDCATMPGDATLVNEGAKLDNLVQVAHNVVIGKNTVIAGQAGISGSTEIGDNCIIAGQVGLAGHLKIHNKTTLAAQAGVSRSTHKEGETLFGYPAYDIKGYMRSYAVFKKLPELYRRLNELDKK